jgi:hydroxypyruvate reductase
VRVLASPEDLAKAVARELRGSGFAVRVVRSSVGSPADLTRDYAARARALRPGEAVVRAAEPSLRVDAARPGRGGRSTHLATLVATALPEGVAFLAGASDGVDGTSGTAGAVVDASLARRASPAAIARALAWFDTAPLLERAAMALDTGPTGTNFADIHVLARGQS